MEPLQVQSILFLLKCITDQSQPRKYINIQSQSRKHVMCGPILYVNSNTPQYFGSLLVNKHKLVTRLTLVSQYWANWNNSARPKSRSHRAHIALASRSQRAHTRSRRAHIALFCLFLGWAQCERSRRAHVALTSRSHRAHIALTCAQIAPKSRSERDVRASAHIALTCARTLSRSQRAPTRSHRAHIALIIVKIGTPLLVTCLGAV